MRQLSLFDKKTEYTSVRMEFQLHKPPVFKEPTKDGQLVIYGENEKEPYPDYLIDLSQRSARHGAILKGKVRFICGNGWEIDKFGRKQIELFELQRLLDSPNEHQTFNEFTNEIVNDFVYIGAFAIECIWNKGGTKIESFASLPIGLLRAVKSGDEFKYCYLPDWRGVTSYDSAKKKKGFKEWNILGTSNSGSEILYVTETRPLKSGECNVYGLPDYVGGITLIEADAEIGNFRLNNIKNGFWVSKIISFNNGVPTAEEQKALKNALVKQHQGSDNAGSWAMLFSDGPNIPTLLDMTGGDLDKQFIDIDKAVETGIGTSHGVTSQTIFGVTTPGALGQRNEMLDAYSLFFGNYISPKQQIIEEAINYIFSFNKVDARLKLKQVGILADGDETLNKLESMSPAIAAKVMESMSGDEIRELAGLKKKQTFSTDYVFSQLEKLGEFTNPKDILEEYEIVKDEFGKYETDDFYTKQHFVKVSGTTEQKIISILKENPKATPEEISKALSTDVDRVQKIIGELIADQTIKGDIGDIEVTEEPEVKVGIRYRYVGPKDSKNREFCAKLISLSFQGKTYSRSELDSIKPSPSAPDEEFSVFDYRGGFWTRKGTNETTPYCRHKWQAVAVRL